MSNPTNSLGGLDRAELFRQIEQLEREKTALVEKQDKLKEEKEKVVSVASRTLSRFNTVTERAKEIMEVVVIFYETLTRIPGTPGSIVITT